MSGGKGGSTSSSITIPDYIEEAARRNLAKAEDISRIGYVPYYGPDVAAFTPMQESAFQQTADVASAFGVGPQMSRQDIMGGMAAPTEYAGGVRGYSAAPMYEQAVSELAARRPAQAEYLQSFFIDPLTGQAAAGYGQPALAPTFMQAPDGSVMRASERDDPISIPVGDPNADSYFGESIVNFVRDGGIIGAAGRGLGILPTKEEQMAGQRFTDIDDPIFAGGAATFRDPDDDRNEPASEVIARSLAPTTVTARPSAAPRRGGGGGK